MDKRDSFTSSGAHSTQPYLNTRVSWGAPDELSARGSAVTKSLNLKADARPEHPRTTKHISFQDQDSSSTQSTGQSSTDVASSGDDNPSRQISFSAQSDDCRGLEETQRKAFANNTKPSSSATGLPGIHFAPAQANFSFQYADPHFGGLNPASYIPQMWNPQMMGMVPNRVPLPLDLIENEPVFVNAKQFSAIMRRRQQRAKLEAQNKIIRSRKPYLHESRHVHALKRPRGSGGRFLNTKKLEESKESKHDNMSDERQHTKGTTSRFMAHQAQNGKDHGSTTSGSDTTSVSDGIDIFGQSEFQISDCPSQTNRTIHVHGQSNGMNGSGSKHHFSVHI